MDCGKSYDADYVFGSKGIPKCDCGGIIKPDVVLYEEPLDQDIVTKAIEAISTCDTLIIGGTSLVVYPAASYVNYFRGKNLVIINNSITPFDSNCTLVIHDKLGNVFSKLKR